MTDFYEITQAVAAVIAKGSKPLTEAQRMCLGGALAVHLQASEVRCQSVIEGTVKARGEAFRVANLHLADASRYRWVRDRLLPQDVDEWAADGHAQSTDRERAAIDRRIDRAMRNEI